MIKLNEMARNELMAKCQNQYKIGLLSHNGSLIGVNPGGLGRDPQILGRWVVGGRRGAWGRDEGGS